MKRIWLGWLLALLLAFPNAAAGESALVFQTDFGLKDGAVSAMKGVAFGVSPSLQQFDLTHEIPPYNVWEGAYRLKQTAPYWPRGAVFVSVVDPGVGTERKAVVLKTKSGHYFVTPDNGTLTFIAEDLGVEELREIDPARHRRPGSEASYTFHGRDLFAFVGAKLAAGKIRFAQVGPKMEAKVVAVSYQHAVLEHGELRGNISVLDPQYGNVWSNIEKPLFDQLGAQPGDLFAVKIFEGSRLVCEAQIPYAATFGDVPEGKPLLYLNSLLCVSLALNQGSFAAAHGIGSGPDWRVEVRKLGPPATP